MGKIKFLSIRLLFVILIKLSLSSASLAQQNIQLTQYIFNSLSVNPAYAGYKEDWFAQMALRNQWTGIQDAPQTGQVSIDGLIDPSTKKMGLGLQIGADKLGPQSSASAYLNYAYRLQLNNSGTSRISFGIGAGLSQFAIDYSKLSPIDAGDQSATQSEASKVVPDLRFGLYYYSSKWYIGTSVVNMLANTAADAAKQGVIVNRRHLYLISGTLIDINTDVKMRPSILIKEDFKGPTSLDLNSMFIFRERLWAGASYRRGLSLWKKNFDQGDGVSGSNSVSGVAQFFINQSLRLGYSYDYTLSRLGSIENGSHEITLGLTFNTHPSKKILTPRFF